MSPVRSILSLALFLAIPAAPLCAQEGLTVEQVEQLRYAVNPQQGDGFAACSMVVPRPLADGPGGARFHVAVIDDLTGKGKPRMLVSGKDSASAMAVRPGTREISFAKAAGGKRQLFTMPIDGGEPSQVADTPSIAAYSWRPDGKAFAFTSIDPMPAGRMAARKAGFRQVVVDEDWRHRSLWVCELGSKPRKMTSDTSVFEFHWSADGKQLACACAPRNLVDDSYMFKRLHTLDVASGEFKQLVDNPGKLGAFAWSPDASSIAYISADDRNDPHAGMLYLVKIGSGEVRPLSAGLLGMIQSVQATKDGFLILESLGVRTRMRHLSPQGRDQWIYEPKNPRLAITGVSAGSHLVFTASSRTHPAELYVAETGSGSGTATRLTNSNPMLADVAMGEQSVQRFRARDGLPIEGLLIKPLNYREGQRYPLVIVAHGGPEAHHSDGWLTNYSNWGQLLAARGYMSWYPNYRASTGYGVEFCKQDHGDPMGKEFEDHIDAIDHFDKLGLIDPNRVGVGGGSYGGYTAAWAATRHSDRFAAAVSFVPFVDIHTKWMTSDIPWEFYYVHYQEKWPWQQPGLLNDRSPLSWAPECRTPLLLAGGTNDTRVHPSQPFMLYRAVKFGSDTPVRYIQYPGEGHGNRTNVYRHDYALRSLRWFDHYLQDGPDRRSAELPPLDIDYGKTN